MAPLMFCGRRVVYTELFFLTAASAEGFVLSPCMEWPWYSLGYICNQRQEEEQLRGWWQGTTMVLAGLPVVAVVAGRVPAAKHRRWVRGSGEAAEPSPFASVSASPLQSPGNAACTALRTTMSSPDTDTAKGCRSTEPPGVDEDWPGSFAASSVMPSGVPSMPSNSSSSVHIFASFTGSAGYISVWKARLISSLWTTTVRQQ